MRTTRWLIPALIAASTCLPVPRAYAQDTPGRADESATEPEPLPEPALTVRELVVFQTDLYGDTANDPMLVPTTLFSETNHSGRNKRGEPGPMPLGLITFEGRIDEPVLVRIDLNDAGAHLHAHWPGDAIKGPGLVYWKAVHEADGPQRAPQVLGRSDWLEPLRAAEDRLWLGSRDPLRKERFLLYDASLPFKPALSLTLEDNQYRVQTTRTDAIPSFTMLVHRQSDGWVSDATTGPWASSPVTIGRKPTAGVTVPTPARALAPLGAFLAERGYNDAEVGVALGMVGSAGLTQSNMSLVYVLPDGQIDEQVRLRLRPEPDRVIRTAIVVVTHIDPDLSSRVQRLIDDLGSEAWVRRDRAQRLLIQMGRAAIDQVEPLLDSKDPEVAFRARQVLDAYDLKREAGR